MKTILLLPSLFLLHAQSFSQVETSQMSAEFHDVTKSTGLLGMQTYNSGTVKGSQFFYPTWAPGSVTTIHNEVITKNYSFLYDRVRQQLFIKWKDSSAVLLAEKDQINAFTLYTDKPHNFVPAYLYNPSNTTDFYEILVGNAKGYTLLKLNKATFLKADLTDMQRVKDGDVYDSFIDNISYYISYNSGVPQQVTFKEKSIEKAFPALKQQAEDYYKQNNSSSGNEAYLTGFVQSLNN